jgi:hypothetical protein
MLEKRRPRNVVFAAMVLKVRRIRYAAFCRNFRAGWGEGGIRTTDDLFSTEAFRFTSESKRYIVGPTVEMRLPERFWVEVAALYQGFGFTEVYSYGIGNYGIVRERTNSWEFPVIMNYRLPIRLANPFVGMDVSSGARGCTPFYNERSATDYPLMQGVVVSAGLSLGAGHFRFKPELRYTIWTAPNLNTYQWVPDEMSVLLGIRWH